MLPAPSSLQPVFLQATRWQFWTGTAAVSLCRQSGYVLPCRYRQSYPKLQASAEIICVSPQHLFYNELSCVTNMVLHC